MYVSARVRELFFSLSLSFYFFRFFQFFSLYHPPYTLVGLQRQWNAVFRKWRWNEDRSPVAARTPSYHLIWYRILTSALRWNPRLKPFLCVLPSIPCTHTPRSTNLREPRERCFLPRTHRPAPNPFLLRAELRENVTWFFRAWFVREGLFEAVQRSLILPRRRLLKISMLLILLLCMFDVKNIKNPWDSSYTVGRYICEEFANIFRPSFLKRFW